MHATGKEKENTDICCSANCMAKLGPQRTEKLRTVFKLRYPSHKDSRIFLIDYFTRNSDSSKNCTFVLGGLVCCAKAFYTVLGLTKTKFFNLKREVLCEGRFSANHGLFGFPKNSEHKTGVTAFLRQYIEENCDFLPNENIIHLPSCTKLMDLYQEYNLFSCGPPISERHFQRIFCQQFPHVKIPKQNRFTKCDTCAKIKEDLKGCHETDIQERIDEVKKAHLKRQQRQREEYQMKMDRAVRYPKQYLCITTDGMDQFKTRLPYSRFCYSTIGKARTLQVHIMGVFVFGHKLDYYMDYLEYPHDANLNLTVILQSLLELPRPLPKEMHLQLDNTCRENKNKFVMRFMAYLVEVGVFDVVTVGFLMVGHTHQILDQTFSRLSTHIATLERGCLTTAQLNQAIKDSYSKDIIDEDPINAKHCITPQPKRLQKVYALREFLHPHGKPVLQNLAEYHHFKFTRNVQGKAEMRAKKWTDSLEWSPSLNEPALILLDTIPSEPPKLVKPNYSTEDLTALQKSIKKVFDVGALNSTEWQEWQNVFENEHRAKAFWDSVPNLTMDKGTDKNTLNYCKDTDAASHWPVKQFLLDRMHSVDQSTESSCLPAIHPSLERAALIASEIANPLELFSSVTESKRRRLSRQACKIQISLDIDEIVVVAPDVATCAQDGRSPTEYPWIGRVRCLPNTDGFFGLVWFNGKLKGVWHPYIQKATGEPFVDLNVHKDTILLAGVQFNSKKHLPVKTIKEIISIMKLYEDEYQKLTATSNKETTNDTDHGQVLDLGIGQDSDEFEY